MLVTLLVGLLGLGAVVAMGAMIGTWRQYGSAWVALAAERSSSDRAPVRYVTVRVVGDQKWVTVPVAEIRTMRPVDRQSRARYAAA